MKKTILKSILAAIIAIASFTSCSTDPIPANENFSKNSNENTIVSKPPPPGLTQFYYIQNGSFYYSSISNPFATASTKTIFGKIGTTNIIEIRLSSLAEGTYSLGGSNKFFYKKKFINGTWVGATGKVEIRFNGSGTISGNFDITSGSGLAGVSDVSGYFENVVINP